MTEKKNPGEGTGNTAQDAAKNARPVSEYTEKWQGRSPVECGIPDGNRETVEFDSLAGKRVVILGISKRVGDKGPWLLCTFLPDGGKVAAVFSTGAAVIVRKLEQVAEANGFPVVGEIVKNPSKAGKNMFYYDFR